MVCDVSFSTHVNPAATTYKVGFYCFWRRSVEGAELQRDDHRPRLLFYQVLFQSFSYVIPKLIAAVYIDILAFCLFCCAGENGFSIGKSDLPRGKIDMFRRKTKCLWDHSNSWCRSGPLRKVPFISVLVMYLYHAVSTLVSWHTLLQPFHFSCRTPFTFRPIEPRFWDQVRGGPRPREGKWVVSSGLDNRTRSSLTPFNHRRWQEGTNLHQQAL